MYVVHLAMFNLKLQLVTLKTYMYIPACLNLKMELSFLYTYTMYMYKEKEKDLYAVDSD